jgi:tripartite-type tricarboxylate transporter receptor subunit TctC
VHEEDLKMKKWRGRAILVILGPSLWLFSSFLAGTTVAVEKDFPKKEITIIVNYGAGGARDILARGVGKTMSKYLGVPLVVMNMPGAGGLRGLISLYHSSPDGYTIGVGAAPEIIDQIIQKQDYDIKKFSYIGRVQSSPTFFFVKSDSSFRSLKDFITFGKPIRQSSFSVTSLSTVPAIILAKREGFPLTIVGGFQGGAAVLLSLIRGEVEFTGVNLSTALSYVRSRQIRAILTIDQKRHSEFPDTPTVVEAGHEDLAILSLDYWFMAPPGVPKVRIQILEDALIKTLKDPEFLEWAKGAAVDPAPFNSEETTKMIFNLFALFEPYKGDIEKYMK